MARVPYEKWISVSEAIIDAEYCGYKTTINPNTIHGCSIVYKGDRTGWCWNKPEQEVKNISFLSRKLTFEEKEDWYKNQFNIKDQKDQLNLMGLFNNMYDCGDAYHEEWNAWIGADWYEMAFNLREEDFILVGISPAPWNVDYIFGEGNSVAFVCENENGIRFWCHGSKRWVEDMRSETRDIYKNLMGEEEE